MIKVKEIKLGTQVKDVVSGFKGIVIGRTMWLNGCARLGVQAKMKKDGTIDDPQWFDEPQLIVMKTGAVNLGPQNTGGPKQDPVR